MTNSLAAEYRDGMDVVRFGALTRIGGATIALWDRLGATAPNLVRPHPDAGTADLSGEQIVHHGE